MGMNYYAIKKKNFERQIKVKESLNSKNEDVCRLLITSFIEKVYEGVFKLAEFNIEESNLEDYVNRIINDLNSDIKMSLEKDYIHIGKSSYGWLFLFQDQDRDECCWHNYDEVMNWLKDHQNDYLIVNEDDEEVSLEEFKKMVDDKQKDEKNLNNPENFKNSRDVNGYRFTSGDFS